MTRSTAKRANTHARRIAKDIARRYATSIRGLYARATFVGIAPVDRRDHPSIAWDLAKVRDQQRSEVPWEFVAELLNREARRIACAQ